MKKTILKLAVKRLKELVIYCTVLSALVSLLCVMGLLPDRSSELVIGLNIAAAIFLLSNFFRQREWYCKMADKPFYYSASISAYIAFVVINLCVYLVFPSKIYTWIFAITKTMRYTVFNMSTLSSLLVFHFIMLMGVFIAPIGMGWVFERKAEIEAKRKLLPPELTVNPLENKPEVSKEDDNGKNKETKENTLS